MTQSVLIVYNPQRTNVFVFRDGLCVSNTANPCYIGKDHDYCFLAMGSIMRYEDGSETQPNVAGSANGYPERIYFTLAPYEKYEKPDSIDAWVLGTNDNNNGAP